MSADAAPTIRFVHGNPTDEEVAAVALVLGRRAGEEPPEPPQPSGWAGYWRRAARPLQPGPDAWRMTYRP